ncbi:MAG: hypothetical protein WC794_04360 [Candidatus Doudnabacteria bacterium]|jgi:hypothetical protein
MLETEKQPNNEPKIVLAASTNQFREVKKTRLPLIFMGSLILIVAVVAGYFLYNQKAKKINSNQASNTQTQSPSGSQVYTYEEAKKKAEELKATQNRLPAEVVLPGNFPKEYIPVSYSKLLSVTGAPNTNNAPYGATFISSGTVEESYMEVKKYFTAKNWNITELLDRKIPNDGKQIVAEINNTTIITTIANQNAETVVNLNIISQSNAK